MNRKFAVAALLLALALFRWPPFGVTPAAGQDEVPTFGEAVDVSVVNLAVYVTRDGEPVTDLTRADFEVFEDGERVPLTNFYVYQPAPRPAAGAEILPAVAAEAEPPVERQSESVFERSEPLFVVAYVDNMNLRPHTRKLVLDRLETFVDGQLAPEDQVMIVTAGHRLRIRQEFSRDREATRQVLAGVAREPALGLEEDKELSRILNEVTHRYTDALAAELDADRIATDFRNQERRLIAQARGTFGMLSDLVGTLGELEGRKMVIHVSDGITAARRTELRRLLARANANQVSFYAIDGGGSRQFGPNTAQQSGNLADFWTPQIAENRQLSREQSLRDLADGTGGKMLLARKNMDRELEGFRDAVAHYYSLGFAPRAEGSGPRQAGARQIRVKVRRKGVEVRYPKSYRLKTSEEKLYERVLTALRLGMASNDLDIEVEFGAARRQEGTVVLPIMVRFPLERLVLIPHEGHHVGSVTVMYAVLDSQGRASEVQLGNLPIRVPEDRLAEIEGQEVGYEVTVAMAPTARRLAVAARDDVGRTMASVKREFKLVDG